MTFDCPLARGTPTITYCTGPDCQCTETLCRCEASSVLNSLSSSVIRLDGGGSRSERLLSASPHRAATTTTTTSPGRRAACCSSSRNSDDSIKDDNNTDLLLGGNVDTTQVTSQSLRPTQPESDVVVVVDLGVRGMTCSMCTRSVEQALQNLSGVKSAAVSLALHSAHVQYDSSMLRLDNVVDAIENVGYEVVVEPEEDNDDNSDNIVGPSVVDFTVAGMTCSMCTQSVHRALSAVRGVQDVAVTLSTNAAHIVFDSSQVTVEALKEAIENVGYDVVDTMESRNNGINGTNTAAGTPVTEDRLARLLKQQQQEVTNRKMAFAWSLVGTLPILIITMVLPHFSSWSVTQFLHRTVVLFRGKYTHEFVLEALLLWLLCTPIQFGCGWPFYKSTYYGLRQGVMGMDVLVAVGTSSSYGYAVWATWTPGGMEYHFFETSAVLICFVLLGKWMQTMAVRRTSQALTHLLQLQPKTAIKVIPSQPTSENGKKTSWNPLNNDPYKEEVVPVTAIETGDFVKILKGASIPADGIIRFGEMTVDESMITVRFVVWWNLQGHANSVQ